MSRPEVGQVWFRNTGGLVLIMGRREEKPSYGNQVWNCYVMCDESCHRGGGYFERIPLLAFGFEELS